MAIDINAIENYIASTYTGLFEDGHRSTPGWGDHVFYYNPDRRPNSKECLPRGVYFVTIKVKPTDGDPASEILENGAYRLNVCISATEFERRFGRPPRWLKREERPDPGFDYRVDDRICPHPIGDITALSVLNPSQETFEALKPTILEGYQLCKKSYPGKLRRWLASQRSKE